MPHLQRDEKFVPYKAMRGCTLKSKMAMKLVTDAVKAMFPRVRNILTDDLYQLMKMDGTKRALVLLVRLRVHEIF